MESEQKYGKYFGVCASFHHSKACLCPICALRPAYGNIMYCAKGSCATYGSGDENGKVGTIVCDASNAENNSICLCPDCDVYRQFAMEGACFCRPGAPLARKEKKI